MQWFAQLCSLSLTLLICDGAFASVTSQNEPGSRMNNLEARQGPAVVSDSSFLRRSFTASAVAGSHVYIDGGEYAYETAGVSNFRYSGTLLSIDLSTSWTNASVNIQSTPKPSGVPTLVSPSLWYSEKNNLLYTGQTGRTSYFGGPPPLSPISLWSFRPDGSGSGTWNNTITDLSDFHTSRPFAPLQAYGGETAVMFGGMANAGTQPIYQKLVGQLALPGLVTFDMASNALTNTSTRGDTVYGGSGFAANGVMQYVPSFGSKGIFVAMGGSVQATETPSVLQSFDHVSVYDPAGKQWYNQSTTGDIPLPRLKSCAAGVASSNGTYDILLYAGFGGVLGSAAVPYDDAHILTLPAFHWTKVNSFEATSPRYGQSCDAVGGSQILTIGGVDANPAIPNPGPDNVTTYESTLNTTADPFTQGLGIFDMSTLSFASGYTANAGPYIQSNPVVKYYAQNPNTKLDDAGLQTLFQTTNFPPPNASSTSSTGTTTSSSNTNHTGAIVGGVIGGLAFLAIIIGAIFFLLRRQRQRRLQREATMPTRDQFHPDPPPPPASASPVEKDGMASPVEKDSMASPPSRKKSDDVKANGQYAEMYHPPAEIGPSADEGRETRAELPGVA